MQLFYCWCLFFVAKHYPTIKGFLSWLGLSQNTVCHIDLFLGAVPALSASQPGLGSVPAPGRPLGAAPAAGVLLTSLARQGLAPVSVWNTSEGGSWAPQPQMQVWA